MFTPKGAFEAISKALIADLEPPCIKACEMVSEVTIRDSVASANVI